MQIDWQTLALQTVNVLVLVWLMAHFFFRPIAAIVAQRQAAAQSLLADADKNRAEAMRLREDAAAERAHLIAAQQTVVADARGAAERQAAQITAHAAEEAAKLRSDVEAALAREQAAAGQAILRHAGVLSVEIAQRLLQVLPPETTVSAFQQALAAALATLPDEDKASLRAKGATLVSAEKLDGGAQHKVSDAVVQALGGAVALTFAVDESVIAGLELHGAAVVVRASWAAALAAAREELGRDAAA